MTPGRDEIVRFVIQALREIQQDIEGGAEEISIQTCPIGDLREFDSLASVEATIRCLEKLGHTDVLEFPSLFIGKNDKKLTVGEVADRIQKLLKKK